MNKAQKEKELSDYIKVIRRRKWLILIPTLVMIVAAAVYGSLLPKIWEVDMIIQPSKFLSKTGMDEYSEIIVMDPKQIAGQINQHAFDSLIAEDLDIDIGDLPKLNAVAIRDTLLVRIYVRTRDPEKAKRMLNSLFTFLKKEIDTKAEIEIEEINSTIKSRESRKTQAEKEIAAFKTKQDLQRQSIRKTEEEMQEIRNRISTLERNQDLALKNADRTQAESLGLLLYSNEIQQSLQYLNTLNELLSTKRMRLTDSKLSLETTEELIKQIETDIEKLQSRKGRIDFTRLIKSPRIPMKPAAPNKKQIVMIAAILGLMIFTVLAFFLEYLKLQSTREDTE